jgi:hypothetical protein
MGDFRPEILQAQWKALSQLRLVRQVLSLLEANLNRIYMGWVFHSKHGRTRLFRISLRCCPIRQGLHRALAGFTGPLCSVPQQGPVFESYAYSLQDFSEPALWHPTKR